MNVVLWIIAGLLAAAFLAAGLMKVVQPRAKLAESGLGWVNDYTDIQVKLIGAVEVLAAIGLTLPALLDIAPILVPLAATGLVIIMVGAIVVHARRKENQPLIANVVLLILAAVVAWGRFGPYAF
ncbi:DoxX family protein [Actinoplanes bogorensis]|uniref:DoxX family protein n=1 Tax=Paractinoplanes bogorensis TaxID=1610840 RepID=A0ABS5Z3V7_9ACTN|nr:DoxX family protein [Actinoplanes bogorensis]MBU2670348.1 DoxX family protein [Actinoplanes bogorensis]